MMNVYKFEEKDLHQMNKIMNYILRREYTRMGKQRFDLKKKWYREYSHRNKKPEQHAIW